MKKLLLLALAVSAGIGSYAQQKDKKTAKKERIEARMKLAEENDPPFKKHSIFGLKLNSDGYGIAYESGKYITARKTRLLQFELNEKFHPKEEKVSSLPDAFGNVTHLKFGKANNFFQFKAGYGQQRLIGGKANKNGVAVSALYAGGLSLGILKPYYVDVEDANNGNERIRYKFSDSIPASSSYNIVGASGFGAGWGEAKFKPGIHAKTALRFDYGRFNETVTAIEAGVNIEYYTSEILQMTFPTQIGPNPPFISKENKLFFNAYISIEFGRRK
ncbi:MAG TPA: hypothetical protein VJ647_05170 [Chitinophagaceae bacterium]|nr:hypothetical protein [Chitinophagaceae bacterium]